MSVINRSKQLNHIKSYYTVKMCVHASVVDDEEWYAQQNYKLISR